MPLVHFSDTHEVQKFTGVRFIMKDASSDALKQVTCLVTYAALQDRAEFDGHGEHWMLAWHEHQSTIEALASANYDQGKFNAHGEVVVDTDELTPLDRHR
jgi:Protein of unknown function (DUF1488)